MTIPGRFKCYSCSHEHTILEREYDYLNGERFARGIGCPENPGKMKETIDRREFYKTLHSIPNPEYAYA